MKGFSAMRPAVSDSNRLLTPAEVAAMFRVDPKTVTRWAKAGKLESIRTLGGHRRYKASQVEQILSSENAQQRHPAHFIPGHAGVQGRSWN
jgi:excisionase family DNA binding protein